MRRQSRLLWRLSLLGTIWFLVSGCATHTAQLDRALLADNNPAAHGNDLAVHYVVHSPDVLDVFIAGRPDWTGRYAVSPDGRIQLGGVDFPRVDGRTTPEIEQLLALHSGVSASQIQVHVAEYRSQHVYILSEVPGLQRVVPYQGPETIVDLLQRVGGVPLRGAPRDIQVLRSHVADGTSPEVFHVDLEAILLKQDQRTNVTLESFDQIYIGQSRSSCVLTCVPPWLQSIIQQCCGMGRS
jgi:protein involved in polysaccharide export with SLBB domain